MSIAEGATPDPATILAEVISASMEFETDLNSERCRTAHHIAIGFADALMVHRPDFDRAAFREVCKSSWMNK
jgi:hypothetical protein